MLRVRDSAVKGHRIRQYGHVLNSIQSHLPSHPLTVMCLSILTNSGETKRTGPGRKSNAEHAINFYEYVLQMNTQDDDGDDDDNDGEETKDNDDVSMDSQEFLDQHNDLCELCSEGGDLLCCSTCNLVFHLGCTRPKLAKVPTKDRWSCSFCIASGVTGHKREARTRRRAAAAVRQMARLRNEMKRGTGDDNGDDDDENGADDENEHDKDDSSSKGDDENEGGDDENEGEDDDEDTGDEEGDEENDEGEKSGEDASDTRKIAATPTTKDETTTDMEATIQNDADEDAMKTENSDHATSSEKRKRETEGNDEDDAVESGARRVRRSRRQPILYNPQTCPASEWQSDEVFSNISQSEKGVPESVEGSDGDGKDGTNKIKEATDDSNKTDTPRKKKNDDTSDEEDAGPIWCTFCNDDPSIPVCCFCACRVCFGKHDGVSARIGAGHFPFY